MAQEEKPTKVEPEEPTANEILTAFLVEKNMVLGAMPEFKPRDDGTFSIICNILVQYKK